MYEMLSPVFEGGGYRGEYLKSVSGVEVFHPGHPTITCP
jgi:hypothetical protein